MRMVRRRQPTLAALFVAMIACAGMAALAEDPAGADQESPVIQRADAMLAEAGSTSEAALRWFRHYVETSLVARVSGDVQTAAEREFDRAVERAATRYESQLGLAQYHRVPEADHQGAWRQLDAEGADLPSRVVVLVHGLDEPGDVWEDVAAALDDAGHTVVRFNYRNDQHPALSADDLFEAMRQLRSEGVTNADLVCHSMGGLVGRDMLTRKEQYAGRGFDHGDVPEVERFIMIGTPNQGSVFAPLRALGEVREQFARWMKSEGKDPHALLGFLLDGDGAAAEALTPGSPYLEDLNSRPLPRGVAITVIIGRASPVETSDLDSLLDSKFVRRTLGPGRVERLRSQADSVVGGVGDGVVTIESAHLAGVEDSVILDGNHRSLIRRFETVENAKRLLGLETREPPGIAVIIDRLDGADAPD